MPRNRSARIVELLDTLEQHYGAPKAPRGVKTAFEWILWEKADCIVDDKKRASAIRELKATIGTRLRRPATAKAQSPARRSTPRCSAP